MALERALIATSGMSVGRTHRVAPAPLRTDDVAGEPGARSDGSPNVASPLGSELGGVVRAAPAGVGAGMRCGRS